MGFKSRHQRPPPQDEVERRWVVLSLERRQALMCFDDVGLVERIKTALQALFEKQALMHQMGIRLADGDDQLAASTLFTAAFQLTWQIGRSRHEPQVILVDPMSKPVLVMKAPFLDRIDMIQVLKSVLTDFLKPVGSDGKPSGSGLGRTPLPRARWKELFSFEPSSISAMERQLVKLVEQALWAMALDPAYEVEEDQTNHFEGALCCDCVPFESWMLDEDRRRRKQASEAKKKHKKKKKPSAAATPSLEPTVEEGNDQDDEEPAEDDSPAAGHCGGSFAALLSTAEADAEAPAVDEADEADAEADAEADGARAEGLRGRCGLVGSSLGGELEDAEEEEQEEEDAEDATCVGTGVFHMLGGDTGCPSSDGGLSLEWPTAASTPPAGGGPRGKSHRPRLPHSPSPTARKTPLHPQRLVCYIWNQTSQFNHTLNLPRRSPHDVLQTPDSAASTPNYPVGSPPSAFSRGSWTPVAAAEGSPWPLSAVVKNTFVDIDDPADREASADRPGGQRAARSVSPPTPMDWRDW